MSDITRRKADHVQLALSSDHQSSRGAGFDRMSFQHNALPELALSSVDSSTEFLGQPISAPFLIGAMTGGYADGDKINRHLAEAAEQCSIPMALGSQRPALEQNLAQHVRRWAPKAILLGNIGGTQLAQLGVDFAYRAVESIEANALIIHLNPLQELVQPNGDQDWRGVLDGIERCCKSLPVPVIIKEVGAGISPSTAQRLVDVGVRWIDVAGRGGTRWASIENARNNATKVQQVAEPFMDWGMDTVDLVPMVRHQCSETQLIASGGVRHGLDIACSIRLGAQMAALAQPFLQPALESTESVVNKIELLAEQLRWVMFLTGSRSLSALRSAPLQ